MNRHSIPAISLILLLLTAFFSLAAFGGVFPQQNGYDQFQKALAKERGEGDLEGAIALYLKVVEEAKDEALAAKAQLRIGICYEKLGLQKAIMAQEAFQKVLDNYPMQIDTVKLAREKLLSLIRAQNLTQEGEGKLKTRQLLSVAMDRFAKVSPDGRFLAYFDYGVGAMAIYELATGKKRVLKSKIKEDEPEGESWSFIWSPDGKAILCNWWQWPNWGWADLRILKIDGTEQRRLFFSEEYDEVYPWDWSSDGAQILAAFYGGHIEGKKMGLISVEGGSVEILRTIDGKWGNMAFSPDDRYIAYDYLPKEEYSRRDISILSVDGKVEIPLVKHPAHDSFLGWSPDGRYILMASDRTGTNDLWVVPVKGGKPAGKPELIKKGLGDISLAGLTQDGSFYYSTLKQMEDVYIAEMDQSKGNIKIAPEKMILSREGSNSWPQYSPDGKSIVYVQGGGIMADRENSLCVRSLDTGVERQFPLKMQARLPRWSPDGRFIFFTAFDRPSHSGIYRLELISGQLSPAWPEEPADKDFGTVFVGVSPDGKSYFYIHNEAEDNLNQLIVRDSETGYEKELFRMATRLPFVASLSPNGKWLAVVSREARRAIQLLPAVGGEPRELYQFDLGGEHPTWLDWSPENEFIIFSNRNEDSGWGLYRISIDGGEPQDMGLSTTYISDIDVHPSGKHLVFSSYGPEWKAPELWVMENFLPIDNEGKGEKQ